MRRPTVQVLLVGLLASFASIGPVHAGEPISPRAVLTGDYRCDTTTGLQFVNFTLAPAEPLVLDIVSNNLFGLAPSPTLVEPDPVPVGEVATAGPFEIGGSITGFLGLQVFLQYEGETETFEAQASVPVPGCAVAPTSVAPSTTSANPTRVAARPTFTG